MTFGSNILTGAFLTLASVPGWTGGQDQRAAVSEEQPRLAAIWHEDDAAELVSKHQGEIE